MKQIRLLAALCSFTVFIAVLPGCTDNAEIPSFIRLDTIQLDSTSYDSVGSISHKIRYAWVFIDDNLQGVYQMPALFPVIGSGKRSIKVFGGVPESGFSSQAAQYIFYELWSDSVALVQGDTAVVSPHVQYKRILAPYLEDFDSNLQISMDRESGQGSFAYTFDGGAKEGPGYAKMILGQGQTELVCTTKVITTPKGELGYYVEMDYMNNCNFLIGVRTSQQSQTVLGLLPQTDWNKIYINVTNQVDVIPGTDLQLFFVVPQDTAVANQEVKIDNLKLVF